MRRNALTILAGLALTGLAGCGTIFYGKPDTALVVVNNSAAPISVNYTQSAANTDASIVTNTQEVLPGYSTRFFGVAGDRLSVKAGDRPPFTVEYSERSQVIEATDHGFNLTKGFNEPR